MITTRPFGNTSTGEAVTMYRLENTKGEYIEVMNYGCTIHSIWVNDRHQHPLDVCLGYDTIQEYEQNDGFLGAVVGRHANRIGGSSFHLNGLVYPLYANNGENHLHGGAKGFDKYIWQGAIIDDTVQFSRLSPHGEEGYPGNFNVNVVYKFDNASNLSIVYTGESDQDTIVNLTNHCYFNLGGKGMIHDHHLQLNADFFTENDNTCLPTGVISKVEGTPMDFTNGKKLGQELHTPWNQVQDVGGYDHNFIILGDDTIKDAGALWCEDTGIRMDVFTTKTGIQVYTANFLTERVGKNGVNYAPFSGVCMETQYFPNSTNINHFPSICLKAKEKYFHSTIFGFSQL